MWGRSWVEVMCYSPEADLIAGFVVGAVAIDAYRHIDDRRDLALVAVPLVLAAHQLVEAVAWWGLEGQVPQTAGHVAVTAYLLIAFAVVPVAIPYAVMRSESLGNRQEAMLPFVLLGVAVSIVLTFGLITNPHSATIGGHYLAYEATIPGGGLTAGLYGIAVCTPLLMSSHRGFVVFGLVNIPVLLLLSGLLSTGLISLWCFWAAVSSVLVARHTRESSRTNSIRRANAMVTD